MATKRYALKTEENFTAEPEWTAPQIARFTRIVDTQLGGTVEAFGEGVLQDPDATSLQVTDAGGLNVTLAAGRGFVRHSTYGGCFFEIAAPLGLTGLAPNSTLYIIAAIDVTADNDTRETAQPLIVVQTGAVYDGGLALAEVVTGASSINSITDLRSFVTLGGGTNGAAWRTGSTEPSTALGVDSDFYLRDTGDFYEKVSGAYVLRGSLKGPQGPAGTNGENGTNGADGAIIRNGSELPDNAVGSDGDYYIRNSDGSVYKRIAGEYVFQFNITGPAGPPGGTVNWIDAGWALASDFEVNDALAHGTPVQSYRAKVAHTAAAENEPGVGANWTDFWMLTAAAGGDGVAGADGTKWHSGTTAPGSSVGVNGDFYFNTTNADVYKKIAGAWTHQVNLKGLKGDKGDTGDTGASGSNGTNGASAYEVAVANGFAGTAMEWLASLVGPQGPAGINGTNGAAATITIGSVTTVSADTPASVTNSGTSSAAILDFQIPKGANGEGGGGGVAPIEVEQTTHGLTVGDNIRVTGNDTYTKAKADSAANAEVVGRVTEVVDVNNFKYLPIGPLVTGSGWTAGEVLFLDPTTDGAVTASKPSTAGQIVKPVLLPINATQALQLDYVGHVVPEESSEGGGGSFNGDLLPWYFEMHGWYGADLALSTNELQMGLGGSYSSTLALSDQNDEAVYRIALGAGTWDISLAATTGGTRGIATILLNDTSVGTLDFYVVGAGSDNVVKTLSGVVVSASSNYLLKIKAATKNASSTDYSINLARIILRRSA